MNVQLTKAQMLELIIKAHQIYFMTTKTIKEKIYSNHFLSSSYDILTEEIVKDVETMEKSLSSFQMIQDSSKSFNSFENFKIVMDDYLNEKMIEIDEIFNQNDENNNENLILVSITAVSDHNKFFIVPWNDLKEREKLFKTIEELAPTFPVPDIIIKDRIYGVMTISDGKWFRATIGNPCSLFQVGDEPSETLYRCFLVDVGRYERISKTNLRELPQEWMTLPPIIKECTCKSSTTIDFFKKWPESEPVELKVISEEDGVLNVDIVDSSMVSEGPSMKFKARKDLLELRYSSVIITKAAQPNYVYVMIENDDFHRMVEDLQQEFRNPTDPSPSPVVGHAYALQFGSRWYRVLLEKPEDDLVAFYVDSGHRQAVQSTMMFYKLPERFMELPAQAVRCSLLGVHPPEGYDHFDSEIFYLMRQFDGRKAVAFFIDWKDGEVGYFGRNTELTARIILYPNGDDHSTNILVGRSSFASLGRSKIEFSDHWKIIKSLPSITLLRHKMGSWKSVRVPKKFNANVSWINKNGEIFLQNIDSEQELKTIRRFLKEKYENTIPSKDDLNCSPGDMCIVKWMNEWFRCTIQRVVSKKMVEVFFEDFGIVGEVDVKDVRLDVSLRETPVQVMRCKLFDVKPKGGAKEWRTKHLDAIMDEAEKWKFRVEVKEIGLDGPRVVMMYKRNSHFNLDMVQRGYADFVFGKKKGYWGRRRY